VVVAFGTSDAAVQQVAVPTSRIIGIKPTGAAYRVLVVDDQPENRKLMSQILEAVGCQVRDAKDGVEGVTLFSEWKPHAVLMDMLMPKLGGAEAIRQIRTLPEGASTFILAVSASAFEENREQARSAGADDFLSKPFHDSDLLERLRVRLGVEYISAALPPAHTPGPIPAKLTGSGAWSAQLPAGIREQLHTAALHADYDRLMSLANELATIDADAARLLRQTVERFDYQQLIDDGKGGEQHA
jgi:CheY-like chemotaxis protein